MEEQKSVEQSKQSMKDYFFDILNLEARKVIKEVTTAKNIYRAGLLWIALSILGSGVNVLTNNCDNPKREIGEYIKARLFCPIK
jgi:hypothetical protein